MAISRAAGGTAKAYDDTSGVSTLTKSGVTCAAGDTIVVSVAMSDGVVGSADQPDSVAWNGQALTLRTVTTGSGMVLSIWSRDNCNAGTGSVVVDSSSVAPLGIVLAIEIVTGAITSGSTDKVANGTGSSTAPSSGATATTSQANELLIGVCAWLHASAGMSYGSWSNSFTGAQDDGNSTGASGGEVTISDGYRNVTATGAYTAAKTGASNVPWAAAILTLQEAVASVTIAASPVQATVSGVAATVVPGLATLTPNPALATASGVAPAAIVAGAITVPVSPATATVSVVEDSAMTEDASDLVIVSGARDPMAVTSQEFVTIRPTSPSSLGDGDGSTNVNAQVTPFTFNPAGGTIRVTAATISDPLIDPATVIDHLVFRASAFRADNRGGPPNHLNFRMEWTVGANSSSHVITNEGGDVGDPSGTPFTGGEAMDPGDAWPPYRFVTTGPIATQPNGQPWDYAAVCALTNVSVAYDYAAGVEWAEVTVEEIIIEVYGPIGTAPDVIAVSHVIGAPVRRSMQLSVI